MLIDEESRLNTPGEFERVLVGYLEAQESGAPGDRRALLAKHPALAAELEQFFAAMDDVDRVTRSFRYAQESPIAGTFADYDLLEELGRGGMGIVYRARRRSLGRIVALKMIQPGRSLSATHVQRFRNEAEAASQLDHPHVVPIYDVGEHDGQLFFTMKLIDGPSLKNWRGSSVGAPAPRAEPFVAADLLIKIARAVHHAHQRGILHRDLKPSNILIDQDGEPHVADFGLAKQLRREQEFTETGAILGTPGYMAPEQAGPTPPLATGPGGSGRAARATTAVDVYGLGAILYDLLTGRPPFQGESMLATLALVRDADPTPPSLCNGRVDGDLAAICLKCLEKEPGRRYESAQALALDLERWRSGLPTLARPAGHFERAWRWCRRNRLLAGMIAVMVLLACFGVGALSVGLVLTDQARQEASQLRQTALANLRAIIADINDLENRRPDLDELRLDLLMRVQKRLEPMLNDPAHGAVAEETNFWLEIDAGDVHRMHGQAKPAIAHYQRALEIAERLLGGDTAERTRRRLHSFAVSRIGDAEVMEGRFDAGMVHYQRMLEVRQELAAHQSDEQTRADLAVAHLKFGLGKRRLFGVTRKPEDLNQARVHCDLSRQMYAALESENPADVWHARMLGYACENVADTWIDAGYWGEALEPCLAGLDTLQKARQRFPEYELIFDFQSCFLLDRLSATYRETLDFAKGWQAAEKSLELRQAFVRLSPRSPMNRRGVGFSEERLAGNLRGLGRQHEARTHICEAVRIYRNLAEEAPDSLDGHNLTIRAFNQLIDHCYTDPASDALTLGYSTERIAAQTAWCQANPQNSRDQRTLFDFQVEHGDFCLLGGRLPEAVAAYEDARRRSVAAPHLDGLEVATALVQTSLARVARASQPGFNAAAELLDQVWSPGLMMRLQQTFYSQGDHARLARVSERLAGRHDHFLACYAAARGFARAAVLAPAGKDRRHYEQRRNELIAKLRPLGDHVDAWLRRDPAFASSLPKEHP